MRKKIISFESSDYLSLAFIVSHPTCMWINYGKSEQIDPINIAETTKSTTPKTTTTKINRTDKSPHNSTQCEDKYHEGGPGNASQFSWLPLIPTTLVQDEC